MASTVSVAKPATGITMTWQGEAFACFYHLQKRAQHKHSTVKRVTFGITPRPHFAVHEVASIEARSEDTWKIKCHMPGLVGSCAALPTYDHMAWSHEDPSTREAITDFYDMFHHRLVTLRYKQWLRMRPLLSYEPNRSKKSETFDAWVPHAAMPLKSSRCGHDQTLHYLAGLHKATTPVDHYMSAQALALRSRDLSAGTIEALLKAYLQLPIQLKSFVPTRVQMPEPQQTRLAQGAHQNQLGFDSVLGSSLPMCAQVYLEIGPLNYATFLSLLPGGKRVAALKQLMQHCLPAQLLAKARLILEKNQIPFWQLRAKGFQLGLNTWLCADKYSKDANDSLLTLT